MIRHDFELHTWIFNDIHWVTNFFPRQILVWFLSIFCKFAHFKIKMTISRKNLPLHVFIFESWWICLGISALFPGISAFFPGISAQKNRHIFTQSRVRSAQKARNPKLTTVVKTWPFPAPSHEIRPKGRNLANGQLFVSFLYGHDQLACASSKQRMPAFFHRFPTNGQLSALFFKEQFPISARSACLHYRVKSATQRVLLPACCWQHKRGIGLVHAQWLASDARKFHQVQLL